MIKGLIGSDADGQDESVLVLEAYAWIKFVSGSLANGRGIYESAQVADSLLEDFRERFIQNVAE